jgi:hypothetical protein
MKKLYRVWLKKTKDQSEPDYYYDTLAVNPSQAALDMAAFTGDYVDMVCILSKAYDMVATL